MLIILLRSNQHPAAAAAVTGPPSASYREKQQWLQIASVKICETGVHATTRNRRFGTDSTAAGSSHYGVLYYTVRSSESCILRL